MMEKTNIAINSKTSESEEANRMWASASFVGVLIIIGIPLWWKTTEVYRVALPYDEIHAFDPLSHRIYTDLVIHADDQSTADEVAAAVEKTFQDVDVIKLRITKSILFPALQQSLDSIAEESEAVELISSTLDLTDPGKFHVVQRKPLFKDVWLGTERVMFFRDGKSSPTVSLALHSWVYGAGPLAGSRAEHPDAARRLRAPPAPAYDVRLTVVHPAPRDMDVRFDAKEAMEDYIGSFVDELSSLHNFTLKSQWIHLLDFDFHTKEVPASGSVPRHWAAPVSRLPGLLTALEERGAPRAAPRPALALVLYVVPCAAAPTVLYDGDKMNTAPIQAFISPKWGGVVLGNPTPHECSNTDRVLYTPDVRRIMGAFVAQLRTLLGIVDLEPIPGAHVERLRSVRPRRWELDSLLRTRTLEQLVSAQRTLQSLAKLLGEISNIVIDDVVGASIHRSVSHIVTSSRLLAARDVTAAAAHAQLAMVQADDAFNAPRLLALLYFPDDQKYAIYIPLFLPILFPVVLSLKKLVLWFRRMPAAKTKTE